MTKIFSRVLYFYGFYGAFQFYSKDLPFIIFKLILWNCSSGIWLTAEMRKFLPGIINHEQFYDLSYIVFNADNKTWQAVNNLKAEDYITLPWDIPQFLNKWESSLGLGGIPPSPEALNKAFSLTG